MENKTYWAYRLFNLSTILFAIFVAVSLAMDSLAISIGLVGLILLIAGREFSFRKRDLPVSLFSLNYFLSSLFSLNPLHNLLNFQYIWHFAPYWIVSRARLNWGKLIKTLAVFGIIGALGVIFNAFFLKPTDIFSLGLSHIYFHMPSKAYSPEGFSGFPSYIGGIMLILTFFFGALGIHLKNKLYITTALFALVAVILTQERQDWLGLLVGLICIPFFVKSKKLWLIYLICAVALIGIAQTPFVKHRLHYTINYTKDPDIVIRFAMIKSSFYTFDHSSIFRKIFGYGPAASKIVHKNTVKFYKQMALQYKINPNMGIATVIDSFYINVLMSCGLLGLFLILSAFFLILRNNIRAIKYANGEQEAVLIGITLGLIAFYIASGFDNLLGSAQVSIFLSFMLGINELTLQEGIIKRD